jgi:hypothetical protein
VRMQGDPMRHLATTAASSSASASAASAGALTKAAVLSEIGFDRLHGLLSGPALAQLDAPRAAPVAARTGRERMIRLIDQIDYLERLERALEAKIASEADAEKRGALKATTDIVRGIKATARVKLVNLSTTAPKQ